MYIMFNHPRLYRKVLAFCNSCYSRSPSIDPATYHDVFALFYTSLMNGFVCSYCGCEMDLVSDDHQVSVDHVVPLARGGRTILLIWSCAAGTAIRRKPVSTTTG